jgi:ATP-dependent exoDNAse (exonuclease V) alpha subunit
MIKNHIISLLKQKLPFDPTSGQEKLIRVMADYITSEDQDEILLVKGYAGTGKTTMLYSLTQVLTSLKIRSILMAPTGRAAKVMAGYTGMPAYTIHKTIYRQQSSADGMGRFVLNKNLFKNTYFIVDEASMISNELGESSVFGSGRLLDDLLEYVYTGENCRLILVGDTAQLPPVGLNISPALEIGSLEEYGFGLRVVELTDVVRQEQNSGILYNATEIRGILGEDEEINGFFPIHTEAFQDVVRISGADLIENISTCYDKFGIFETTVVTRSNKRANVFNKGIRGSILFKENEIERGDLLMVVKNNYFWATEDSGIEFIANGDIAEIITINGYEDLYGFRFADVSLRFVDYESAEIDCKIFLDSLAMDTASFSNEQNRQLFEAISEDYLEVRNRRERWKKIKENPYFNALQVKYAYALTCHKAQGGQWKAVFVDHGYLTEDMLDKEYYRWLYTAFTRPTEKLFLVNFDDGFFE